MTTTKLATILAVVAVAITAAVAVLYIIDRDDKQTSAERERDRICEVQQDTIAVLEANLAGGSRIFVKLLPANDPDLIEASEAIADRIADLRASQQTLHCPPELVAPLGPESPIGKGKPDRRLKQLRDRARPPVPVAPPSTGHNTVPRQPSPPSPRGQRPGTPTRGIGQLPDAPSLPPRPSPLIQIDPPPVGPIDIPPIDP